MSTAEKAQLGAADGANTSVQATADGAQATLALAAAHDAHLVLAPNPAQHPHGDFGFERGIALPQAAQLYTFTGIAVYREVFFNGCVDGVFPLKPLLLRSMAAGRCSAELYTGLWEDVGTPERLAQLNARMPAN